MQGDGKRGLSTEDPVGRAELQVQIQVQATHWWLIAGSFLQMVALARRMFAGW